LARLAKEGIGAVGLRNVEAIAWGRRIEPMCVSGGPGPLFPLDPSVWQARHPDWPTTSAPASKVCFCAAVRLDGGYMSTELGDPVEAPV
jgi:hypothetical protein